ncbi:uncharacterized protein LOC100573712 [Acyrthosiphon pisum]|uniref:Uncharacterized protein n=1 Tax=Acyrthosiphon pisum TaxID=7029 RepID=A0A8R2AAI0_ACYPI|nr:uncharacterized protein LOC100573712 [Acyrthosiphon pisum]|eukprot:XP_003244164.1 PREDICTED: uncharacterized protein LOC100573712 [Acyrthosiphon pisum]
MCNRSTTIDEIVKDRISIRLIETKWVDKVENLVYVALQKRNEGGQDSTTVKFEELYQDVCTMARDVLPVEMENELHEKMNDFLSSNIDGSDNPYTMNLSESNSPRAVNVDTPSGSSSNVLNDILDITLEVTTNEKTRNR